MHFTALRQTNQSASHSRFARLTALVLLAVWMLPFLSGSTLTSGFMLESGTAASLADSGPAKSAKGVAQAASALVCHCAHCPGGKLCCCAHPSRGGSGPAYRCRCARETAAALAIATIRIFPGRSGVSLRLPCGSTAIACNPAGNRRAPSRAPAPVLLPPRLS